MVKAHTEPLLTVFVPALKGPASPHKVAIISVMCIVLLTNQANWAQPKTVTKISPPPDVQLRDEAAGFRFYTQPVIFIFIKGMNLLWGVFVVISFHEYAYCTLCVSL